MWMIKMRPIGGLSRAKRAPEDEEVHYRQALKVIKVGYLGHTIEVAPEAGSRTGDIGGSTEQTPTKMRVLYALRAIKSGECKSVSQKSAE
jgi:hypothetical protein